jgi:hypothetical protein
VSYIARDCRKKEGKREKEREKEREGGKEKGREGRRKGGREGGREEEEGRKGEKKEEKRKDELRDFVFHLPREGLENWKSWSWHRAALVGGSSLGISSLWEGSSAVLEGFLENPQVWE